ncbi:hypothetical protein GCM10027592_53550 [Spirosoma flavus]
MLRYLRPLYYLSFPVVIGAVLSNRMATRLSDVTPVHWATPLVLALAVFIIYTIDRLLDVRRYEDKKTKLPLTERHRFHYQYAPLLWKVVIGATVLAIILTFFLPASVVKFGIVLGGVCAAYVGAVFRLPERHPALLLKEPLVALLYATGVWGSVWVQRPIVRGVEVAEWLMFVGIAFQNLLLFAVMEKRESPKQPFFSLATAIGLERCDTILRWLTFLVVATGLTLCFVTDDRFAQRSALMLAIMSITLYAIQRYPNYFIKNERYRWLGDGVFWMPALVL